MSDFGDVYCTTRSLWSHARLVVACACVCWLPLACWPYGKSSMPIHGQASWGTDERLLSVAIWEAAFALPLLSSWTHPHPQHTHSHTLPTPSQQNCFALREGFCRSGVDEGCWVLSIKARLDVVGGNLAYFNSLEVTCSSFFILPLSILLRPVVKRREKRVSELHKGLNVCCSPHVNTGGPKGDFSQWFAVEQSWTGWM